MRSQEEDYWVEKSLSLTYEEATALLDMSLLTYAEVDEEASRTALRKLSALCRQFEADRRTEEHACVGAVNASDRAT